MNQEETNTTEHAWIFDGIDIRQGKHWYKCKKCNSEDWIASYGTKDQLRPEYCKNTPETEV